MRNIKSVGVVDSKIHLVPESGELIVLSSEQIDSYAYVEFKVPFFVLGYQLWIKACRENYVLKSKTELLKVNGEILNLLGELKFKKIRSKQLLKHALISCVFFVGAYVLRRLNFQEYQIGNILGFVWAYSVFSECLAFRKQLKLFKRVD